VDEPAGRSTGWSGTPTRADAVYRDVAISRCRARNAAGRDAAPARRFPAARRPPGISPCDRPSRSLRPTLPGTVYARAKAPRSTAITARPLVTAEEW